MGGFFMVGVTGLEPLLLRKPCATSARQLRFSHSFFKP